MKPSTVILASLLFAAPAPSLAQQWVDARGGSCAAACSAIGSQPMVSGLHANGRPYAICAGNAFNEGFRPGYNLEPSWSKGCWVGFGGKEVAVPDYACLCEGAQSQPGAGGSAAAAPAGPPRPPAPSVAAAPSPVAPPPAQPGLTASSFKSIAYADLEKWNSSGCSFAVFRGKNNLALFDTQDPKKTAVFKIDGKLLFVPASGRTDSAVYWAGKVAGHDVRMIRGKKDPNYKSDGGGEGGQGRLEWNGPAGDGFIPITWSEGC